MSVTQFAMVEELASLVKDNYPSRHLILAVEDALVNYLQKDPSPDGTLELQPMSSYDRLILHRLADIFGFAHESVGEGDDRHLVFQRCLETSIPSVLVSDILWQHEACVSSQMPYQLLRRDDICTELKMNSVNSSSYVDREAAYLAARERIFGMDEAGLKDTPRQKPRTVPVVARRMIAHALGQRLNPSNQAEADNGSHGNGQSDADEIERRFQVDLKLAPETSPDSGDCLVKNVKSLRSKASVPKRTPPIVHDEKRSSRALNGKSSGAGVKPVERNGQGVPKMSMRDENFGAAKRMFANALGIQSSKDVVSRREVRGATE